MHSQKIRTWILSTLLLVLALAMPFAPARADEPAGSQAEVTNAAAADPNAPVPEYDSIKQLKGKRFCEVVGGQLHLSVKKVLGEQEFSFYPDLSSALQAVLSNKADVVMLDEPVAALAVSRTEGLAIVPDYFSHDRYGLCLQKGSKLTEPVRAAVEKLREEGVLDELREKWMENNSDKNTLPKVDWDTSAGTLVAECDNAYEPMGYMQNGELKGYEPELMMLVARELNMGVELRSAQAAAMFNDLTAGKCDIMGGVWTITDEREEKVDMVEEYQGGTVAVVRAKSTGASSGGGDFFARIASSFERTFIKENRWQMVLAGLGVTLIITGASGVLGVGFAYLLCLLRRRQNRVANAIINGFGKVMGGLPVIVILMILYYVVFGAIDLSGVIVSIVGFTLIFGMSAHAIMQAGIDSVDPGQEEGAIALGYSRSDSFHKVIFPQAARQFLPVLSGEVVGLLKNTSVVGYIAVEDLTRVSDLIRARTMEAFFPLIATAIIYFAFAMLIGFVAGRISRRLAVETRTRTIKDVDMSVTVE